MEAGLFKIGDKNEIIKRAISGPNGQIYTLSLSGKIPQLMLSQYILPIRVKRVELPGSRDKQITINKNGDVILADTNALIFVDKEFKLTPVFLNYDIRSNPSCYVSALTTNNRNEIIMVVSNTEGKRFFGHLTPEGNLLGIYPIASNYPAKHTSIAVGADDTILLTGPNGIDVYDPKFNFIKTLIPEKSNEIRFTIDPYNNIFTIGNKEIRGYFPTGQLIVQTPVNVDHVYDFGYYPGKKFLILYSREPTWGVPIQYKLLII